jgi:hypothetical protein
MSSAWVDVDTTTTPQPRYCLAVQALQHAQVCCLAVQALQSAQLGMRHCGWFCWGPRYLRLWAVSAYCILLRAIGITAVLWSMAGTLRLWMDTFGVYQAIASCCVFARVDAWAGGTCEM